MSRAREDLSANNPSSILALTEMDFLTCKALSVYLANSVTALQQRWQFLVIQVAGIQAQATRRGFLSDPQAYTRIQPTVRTAISQAAAKEAESFAWSDLAMNIESHLFDATPRTRGPLRSIFSLVPSAILESVYLITFKHLTVGEQFPVPSTLGLNWHSEKRLQDCSQYRNPLIGLSSRDLDYSVPNPTLVDRFASMSIVGLLATLSQDNHWEWEAYLELQRRAIIDWKCFGVDEDFPQGGIYATRIENNERLMRDYDQTWSITKRDGKTAMWAEGNGGEESANQGATKGSLEW